MNSVRDGHYDGSMTKVLVVEPDEPLMRMLGWILIDAGFAVVCARDFDEALEKIPEVRPDVTVLDGDRTADMCADPIGAVRTRWRTGRVMLLRCPQSRRPSEITTADATLTKPFHADSLVAAIDDLCPTCEPVASPSTPVAADLHGDSLPPSRLWKRAHKQDRCDA
jgi:DNA-binding response OmpR family regulator